MLVDGGRITQHAHAHMPHTTLKTIWRLQLDLSLDDFHIVFSLTVSSASWRTEALEPSLGDFINSRNGASNQVWIQQENLYVTSSFFCK